MDSKPKDDLEFKPFNWNSYKSYKSLLSNNEELSNQWNTFFQSFNQLGNTEVNNRNSAVLRLLKENGVTYNIYDDPAGLNRAWQLDLLPFMISKEEWSSIEAGLIQRAELFNLILKDIYGEKKLFKDGVLPMEPIYRHPGFLRECDGIQLPGKNSLILYAADMARGTDGKIWIVSDRTQAPSGSGYALENRTALARVLPELFNGLKVRWLSPYFNVLSNSLKEISHDQQGPRVVILTPGPINETYFEHSYLASYLGFTLVEGNDLVVKDNFVWLKTLEGLEKVDVILRRVDDDYCDPLELKEDSHLGVPGLLQVVRSGNVSIANPLGSSILENPAIMPFLENICEYFFGRGLIIPNIASWWCGQPKELNYVLDNIQSLVIKRIYRETGKSNSIDSTTLSKKEVEQLKQEIKANPQMYVGQEKVFISSSPSLVKGDIVPRNTLLRSFLVSNGESYTALAGGLGRTSSEEGNFVISNQLGDVSKDTWVMGAEPENLPNNRAFTKDAKAFSGGVLPSHTAENLFWVGRYTERTLGSARFMRTVIQYITEGNRLMKASDIDTEQSLLKALTQYTYTYPGFCGDDNKTKELLKNSWPELSDLLVNDKRGGTLKYNYNLFNNAVFSVRDHWSTDTWRVLRSMEEQWAKVDVSQNPHLAIANPLDNLITSIVAFVGLNRESISRDQGWMMMDIGRKMEQSLLLTNMLLATLITKHDEQVEYNLLESILSSNECLINYRYKYRAPIQLSLVIDLMIFDHNNPRSLVHQLDRLRGHLRNLPKNQNNTIPADHDGLIASAYKLLEESDKDNLSAPDEATGEHIHLEDFLMHMNSLLLAINSDISKKYFKHAQKQQQILM
jgi:uncharacterized circularly permuted ATP-grasp superfamily protein/uncharacterized alpha-E superfamily protein